MNKVAKCKFCKEDKKLIDAHIIPRAFVRNKVKEYNNKNLIQIKKDTIGYKIIKSNSYFDGKILCHNCDNKFCDQTLIESLENSYDANIYNYRKISIAIKAILWKAYITTIQEFNQIDLGKIYGDKLYNSLKHSIKYPEEIPPQDFLM